MSANEFGRVIAQARKRIGLSQRELMEEAFGHARQGTVSDWERGRNYPVRRARWKVRQISRALKLNFGALWAAYEVDMGLAQNGAQKKSPPASDHRQSKPAEDTDGVLSESAFLERAAFLIEEYRRRFPRQARLDLWLIETDALSETVWRALFPLLCRHLESGFDLCLPWNLEQARKGWADRFQDRLRHFSAAPDIEAPGLLHHFAYAPTRLRTPGSEQSIDSPIFLENRNAFEPLVRADIRANRFYPILDSDEAKSDKDSELRAGMISSLKDLAGETQSEVCRLLWIPHSSALPPLGYRTIVGQIHGSDERVAYPWVEDEVEASSFRAKRASGVMEKAAYLNQEPDMDREIATRQGDSIATSEPKHSVASKVHPRQA